MFHIWATSDLHLGILNMPKPDEECRLYQHKYQLLMKMLEAPQPSLLLIAGDITNTGTDGRFVSNTGTNEQYSSERSLIVNETQIMTNLLSAPNILVCPGNHDEFRGADYDPTIEAMMVKMMSNQNVRSFYRYRSLTPKKDITFCYHLVYETLNVICLGKYPTEMGRLWLHDRLQTIPSNEYILLFFHYHFHTEEIHHEMKKDDLLAFWDVVRPYKNQILAVITGHNHHSNINREPADQWIRFNQRNISISPSPPGDLRNIRVEHFDRFQDLEIDLHRGILNIRSVYAGEI